jgi:hypothetical protein
MRLLRDFYCQHCGTETERLVDSEERHVECKCGHMADRVIGMPRVSLEGITGAFPGAADHWAKIREEKFRSNARKNAEQG